jgi:putative sporulation protein YtaF
MLLSVILIGVTLSTDSALVGITYGIRGTKIPFFSFMLILLFSIFYAAISILFGSFLNTFLDHQILTIIGALMLAALGLNMILSPFRKGKSESMQERDSEFSNFVDQNVQILKNPQDGDVDHSGAIEPKEAFFLTLALSGDSLVAGIASGMLSVSVWLFPIVTGLFQTLFLCVGILLGNKCNEKINLHDKYISILAGIAMITFSLFKLI